MTSVPSVVGGVDISGSGLPRRDHGDPTTINVHHQHADGDDYDNDRQYDEDQEEEEEEEVVMDEEEMLQMLDQVCSSFCRRGCLRLVVGMASAVQHLPTSIDIEADHTQSRK